MSTNTTGTDARDFKQQMVHYMRRTIAFDTFQIDTANTVKVGTLPAGAVILEGIVKVNTAFNAGTTNYVNVGIDTDDDAIVDQDDVDLTAEERQSSYRGSDLTLATAEDVYVTYTQSGNAATTGEAEIIVLYIPDNDR